MYDAAKKETLLALYQHTLLTPKQLAVLLRYRVPSIYGVAGELKKQGLVRRVPLGFLRDKQAGYVLSSTGAKAAAALCGEEEIIRPKAWDEDPIQLEHLYGANEFFISLIRHSLTREHEGLAEWLGARDAAERYAHFKHAGQKKYYPLRPDGYGTYVTGQGRLVLHLEYDTGTENLSRLQDKLWSYARVLTGIWNDVESVHVLVMTKAEGRPERILQLWETLCKKPLLGLRLPQVWAITETEWHQGGFCRALWLGKDGKRKTLQEMPVLPMPGYGPLSSLGKQQRERSPAEKWKKSKRQIFPTYTDSKIHEKLSVSER
ncbi:replication-relaxation family protein [Cohnella laeviribosi]|uniref:replication-relaxation family protein n=1 Tax=Cohnella laeviribosi TaxID=380174 RepID=UPI0003620820|nr:replication-relaxation family protein [Cohnella laeviribosi]